MTNHDDTRGVHDVGGLPGGAIDRDEHDPTFWEQRVDALMTLVGRHDPNIFDVAELRRGIETLPSDAYLTLSYYERWIASIATILVEKGVVGREELDARIALVAAREATGP
jgi:hypothetical protein